MGSFEEQQKEYCHSCHYHNYRQFLTQEEYNKLIKPTYGDGYISFCKHCLESKGLL